MGEKNKELIVFDICMYLKATDEMRVRPVIILPHFFIDCTTVASMCVLYWLTFPSKY